MVTSSCLPRSCGRAARQWAWQLVEGKLVGADFFLADRECEILLVVSKNAAQGYQVKIQLKIVFVSKSRIL